MKKFLFSAVALVIAVFFFLFVIAGGLDKLKPPISIVVPPNYTGAVCIEIVSESADQNDVGVYAADASGNLKMSESLMRSHRQKKLFRKSQIGSELEPVPNSEWTPVRTEGGQSGTASYMLYWIGPITGLNSNPSSDGAPVCTKMR